MNRGLLPALRALLLATAVLAPALPVVSARPARANGAYPDSLSILAPAQRPHELHLSTNFGLVSSFDDGETWQWHCEQELTNFGFLYQMGPAPRDWLYALSTGRLVLSDDSACTWAAAATPVAGMTLLDAFPDPTDDHRVLAIALEPQDGDGGAGSDGGLAGVYQVLESSDGGATFGAVLYIAPPGDTLTGVESARSRPDTIYLTVISGAGFAPKLARSTDAGARWQLVDLRAALGADTSSIRLIAIDPDDPLTVFLRVRGAGGERLAVTSDGGDTFRTPLTVPGGILTSSARLANGTLVVGGIAGTDPVAFRSRDSGQSFQRLPTPPNLRGLAARGAALYGVADNVVDGYAIGLTTDEGDSWRPIMRYEDIQAIAACVKSECQDDCLSRAQQGQWPEAFCAATAAPRPLDGGAGTGGGDAASDAGKDAAPDAAGGGGGGGGGCGCAAGGGARVEGAAWSAGAAWSWLLVVVAGAIGRSRRAKPKAEEQATGDRRQATGDRRFRII